jgi:NAD(P)-dependent dehydrogenase (short-subunit alcohol dehydrogenase family)
VYDVNVKGAFLACKLVIPHMQRQGGGSIVHISSIASVGWTGHALLSYQSSKAALNQLTRMVAVQHGPDGIRCNCILPGLIDSPRIYQAVLPAFGGDVQKMRASRSKAVPMQRMGDVWDVANAALFFASDESKYVTGVMMPVDGGITCSLSH